MAMREIILEIEPRLEQVIAWNSPQFKLNGKNVAGLCAFKSHLTFSPQSAEVMSALADDLADYVTSKSSFQFAMDTPLPKSLITKLIQARIKEIEAK